MSAEEVVRLGGIGDEAAPDLTGQIAVLTELGWGALELRAVDGVPVGDLAPDDVARVAAAVSAGGLTVPCVDSRIGNWAATIAAPFADDLAELDAVARVARAVGARYVRVMSYPGDGRPEPAWAAEVLRRFRALTDRAAELDVVLVHENCSGWAGTSAANARALLEAVDSPHLRALFDIGNPVAHGYDGLAYLAEVLPWVVHVHVKDAVADGAEVRFVEPGAGQARVTECLDLLDSAGYPGVFSAEPHVAVLPHAGEYPPPDVVRERFLAYGRRMSRLWRDRAAAAR